MGFQNEIELVLGQAIELCFLNPTFRKKLGPSIVECRINSKLLAVTTDNETIGHKTELKLGIGGPTQALLIEPTPQTLTQLAKKA